MFCSGIIDPVKVSCRTLEYAASVAGMFITIKCANVKNWRRKKQQLL
jgi:chaperonin GroEL (HSP60 family)